jgi:predicted SAM-dependent methyltransferase
MFLHPRLNIEMRYHIMRIIFGGRTNPYDVHYVGLTLGFLSHFLSEAGFRNIHRVPEFDLFNDCSSLTLGVSRLASMSRRGSSAGRQ